MRLLLSAVSVAIAVRLAESRWSTITDLTNGACSAYFYRPLGDCEVRFPLVCSGDAYDLKITSWATGNSLTKLYLDVDEYPKQYDRYPFFPIQSTRSWPVSHNKFTAGRHYLWYRGSRLDLKSVEVEGSGAPCSFSYVPGYDPESWTNRAFDVLNRAQGPKRDFDAFWKRQLHFSSEVQGTSHDGQISSSAMHDGVWRWMFEYHRNQSSSDTWLSKKRDGAMYDESDITPYPTVSLGKVPGFEGQRMQVVEPCNTVSNWAYHQTALWVSCQGLPFKEDQHATLIGSLNALAAGSGFFHASATYVGQDIDVVGIQLVLYDIHQIMIGKLIDAAPGAFTEETKHQALTLNSKAGMATDVAREMTSLFRGEYNRDKWATDARDMYNRMPDYLITIVALVLTVVESLDRKWPIPGVGSLVYSVINLLLDAIGGDDIDFMKNTFRPIISKAFSTVELCGSIGAVFDSFIKFAVTFGEAFIFQEEQIPVPQELRQLLSLVDVADGLSPMKYGWDYYNGQEAECHKKTGHCQWHDKSAHGFVHLIKIAEQFMYQIRPTC